MLSPQFIIPNYQNTEAYQLEVVIYILHLFLVIELIYKEVCSSQRGELTIRSWEFKDLE